MPLMNWIKSRDVKDRCGALALLPAGYTPGRWRYDNSPTLEYMAECFDQHPNSEVIGFKSSSIGGGRTAEAPELSGPWVVSRGEFIERLKLEGLICP